MLARAGAMQHALLYCHSSKRYMGGSICIIISCFTTEMAACHASRLL